MADVLVVYHNDRLPWRATIRDHLFSFGRYGAHTVSYWNLAVPDAPGYLRRHRFDVVIFHTIFLSARWTPAFFAELAERVRWLASVDAVKVALPQDEFIHTDVLCDFINAMGIDVVGSVAPPSEWDKIYKTVDRSRTRFIELLTGYLDEDTLATIETLASEDTERPVDVCYRAWRAEPWLGRHGFLKTRIADVFALECAARGIRADISTSPDDVVMGDAWFRFLLRSRYTIGVEGGASMLDHDGTLRATTNAYTAAHPDASFDEVEAACFPGRDGELKLFAISPRHLEAAATRTCQVLVEGRYSGLLMPGRHFIELKSDLSNLDSVLKSLGDEQARAAMVDRAYKEVALAPAASYRGFVEAVLGAALSHTARGPAVSLAGRLVRGRLTFTEHMIERTRAWRALRMVPPSYRLPTLAWSIGRAWVAEMTRPARKGVRRMLGSGT